MVRARNAVKVDRALPIELLGPLGCGFLTGAGTVLLAFRMSAGDTFVVFGAGAVGLAAIMAAKATAATVLAVDRHGERLDLAERLGAIPIPASSPDIGDEIRRRSNGGARFALDTTGSGQLINDALSTLLPRGTLAVISRQRAPLTLAPGLLDRGRRLVHICEGDAVPGVLIPRLIGLWLRGLLPFDQLITTYPLLGDQRRRTRLPRGPGGQTRTAPTPRRTRCRRHTSRHMTESRTSAFMPDRGEGAVMPQISYTGVDSGVGRTALLVAAARAIETHRSDALTSDIYAEHFVRAAKVSSTWPVHPAQVPGGDANPLWGRFARYFGLRTRVFDDFLVQRAHAGTRQIVLLGAGLDTRAFRLDWPSGQVIYEIDRADVLAFKHDVLDAVAAAPSTTRHPIAADLGRNWARPLLRAGFDPAAPTAWLVEGVLFYLLQRSSNTSSKP